MLIILQATPQFDNAYSFTLYSKDNKILGARVAKDEQWRFPPSNSINKNYQRALLTYEDKNFYFHFGIDPLAVTRAIHNNFKSKRIVSGASTISMQLARLSEKNKKRTLLQKIKESFFTLFLELAYSKKQILNLYAANAPYGGNVVGLEAASWKYFARGTEDLTWAEAATLAILPNQPALLSPHKNSNLLKIKRNKLLNELFNRKEINEETYRLSLEEIIPEEALPLPNIAVHYLEYLKQKTNQSLQHSNIDFNLQNYLFELGENKFKEFSLSGVHNIAILVLETKSGAVLGYLGNAGLNSKEAKNEMVDMVQAKRSSGSLLKPFLFAGMIDAGLLLPEQLMIDIPTKIAGYSPENSTHQFTGAIPADKALAHSLNIPFVRALREFTIPAFLDLLKRIGLTSFNRTADEYGLPLILGGGEITLFEITNAYRKLFLQAEEKSFSVLPFSAGAARLTLDALTKANRPEEEAIWHLYSGSQKIAWKTGTSYGNKDAWSIGLTEKYTLGVWCGNADGEGRPEITSTKLAAPILFEVFSILPKSEWPELNKLNFEYITACGDSGYLASKFCAKTKQTLKPINSHPKKICPYCKAVSLSPDGKFQVKASDIKEMPKIENRFSLPAGIEYFYKQSNPSYNPLPPWIKNSAGNSKDEFEITHPENNSKIFIPIELSGDKGAFVAQASHKNSDAILFWDLDGEYLGKTENYHQMKIQTGRGKHILTVTDNRGKIRKRYFSVLEKE